MASRRQYVTANEVLKLSGYTATDDQISFAEEIIDGYCGFVDRFLDIDVSNVIEGRAQGGSTTQLTLENRHSNVFLINFFTFCEIEIVGGAGAGQRTIIQSSTYPNTVVTFRDALTTPVDSTSYYRIYQLGCFPRKADVYLDAIVAPTPTYIKNIPEGVKRATAAQVEYMMTMPSQFFQSDDLFKQGEKIGDYMYTKVRAGTVGFDFFQLVSPKAKLLLRGYTNRKGQMIT